MDITEVCVCVCVQYISDLSPFLLSLIYLGHMRLGGRKEQVKEMSEEKEESKGWRGREKQIVLQGNMEGNNPGNQETPFRYKYTGFSGKMNWRKW